MLKSFLRSALAGLLLALLGACAAPAPERSLSDPTPIASPAAGGSGEPYVAVSPDGEVYMSWFEPLGEGHALRVARLQGETWGDVHTIASGDSFFVNWADYPKLLPLGGGRVFAHYPWMNGSGTYSYDVIMRYSDDGGATWGPHIRPHTDATPTEHGFVSMVPAGQGVRTVWLDGRKGTGHADGHDGHGAGADMTLRSAVVHADGSLSEEAELDGRTCECCGTSAVPTSYGTLVAYRDRSDDEIRDNWLVTQSGEGWGEPRPLHVDGWQIAGCPVNGPALAAHDDVIVAVWYTAAADTPAVYTMFSSDGGSGWGQPMRVDEGDPIGRVAAIMLDATTAIVTWMENLEDGAAIRVRRQTVDGDGETVTLARTSSSRASGFPQIARDADRLLFAWTMPGDTARVHVATMPVP